MSGRRGSHEIRRLTYEEVRERAEDNWLAVIPTGCTEQQGPHLPVDFDTWFAERVALAGSQEAARKFGVRSFVLPVLPFGPTPEHRGFGSGYIDVPVAVHEGLVLAGLRSLADQGFGRIVVWRGCGGHELSGAVDVFNGERADGARAYLPGHPFHDVWCRIGDPSIPGGHADSRSRCTCALRASGSKRSLIPPTTQWTGQIRISTSANTPPRV